MVSVACTVLDIKAAMGSVAIKANAIDPFIVHSPNLSLMQAVLSSNPGMTADFAYNAPARSV
jgi:3-oxoacyl-[acyl-carrier-protein] synthase III